MKIPAKPLSAVVTVALLIAGLAACSSGGVGGHESDGNKPGVSSPVLPNLNLTDLLPSKDDVADRLGSKWSMNTEPSSAPVPTDAKAHTFSDLLDASTIGQECYDAQLALLDVSNNTIEFALETFYDGDGNLSGWQILRAKSADAAKAQFDAFKTGAITCAKTASLYPEALLSIVGTSQVDGAFAYELPHLSDDYDRVVTSLHGDLILYTSSRTSNLTADQMMQLQLDKIAGLEKKG